MTDTSAALPPSLTLAPIVVSPPDLLDDLPPFERKSYDIQAVLVAVGNELARIEAARQEIIANYFPGSADALLAFFEQMIGIAVMDPTMSLTLRQTTVLAYMNSIKSSGSGLDWEAAVDSVAGTGWSYSQYDPQIASSLPPYTVQVLLPFATTVNAPTGLTAAGATGSGTLKAGSYFYAVTATTAYGETPVGATVEATLSAAGHATLSWTANGTPTTGYNVYRGATAAALSYLGTSTTTGFTDSGSVNPTTVVPPSVNNSGSAAAYTIEQLIRRVTPAHMALEVGYIGGFVVGFSDVGIEPL